MLLDAEQLECVQGRRNVAAKHVLIQAVPGSGKTRTMAAKCKYLIDYMGIEPSSITVVTFTNKAAAEIKNRIDVAALVCGTFHSVALQVMQREKFDLFDDDVTMVTDAKAAHTFFTSYLKDNCVQLHKHATAVVKAYNLFRTSREGAGADVPTIGAVPVSVLFTAFGAYQSYKRQHNLVDFDDLLHYWHSFIEGTDTHTLNTRYLLVDEVQDCNNIQFDIIRAFARHGTHVVAVGDADQSIYAFRGANVQHIQTFADTLPDTTQLTLHRNYRSTPEICDVAQCIIDFNSQRARKPMQSMHPSGPVPVLYPFKHAADELQFITNTCQRALYEELECAVLCRSNREVDEVCKALQMYHVQYALLRGTNLFDKRHVKLLMNLLTFVLTKDPPDEVVVELFVAHKQLVKAAALHHLQLLQADTELNSLVEVFLSKTPPVPLSCLHTVLLTMRNALQQVHGSGSDHTYSAYGSRIMATLMMYLRDTFEYTLAQMHDVRQVDNVREGYKTFDLFLKAVQLGTIQVQSDASLIQVGTLHQAKSLEFECVIITGCANGSIPSFLSNNSLDTVEEERRLLYVGATRAKQQLCFTFAIHGSFDRKQEKPRQLSYLLAPFVTMLVVKQNSQLLQAATQPTTFRTLPELISNFYKSFGRFNCFAALLTASVFNLKYYMDFMSEAPQQFSTDLVPTPLHNALFRHLLQSFIMEPHLSLQTRVQEVTEDVFGADQVVGSVCLTLRTCKWVQVLHDMATFAQRLLAAEPSPLLVQTKVVHAKQKYECTVDVLVSRSLFCVVYDTEPILSSLLNVYLTAAFLHPRVHVTTLVLCNLYTGKLYRQPFQPLPCHQLPMAMQAHPLIQLLHTST